MYYFVAKDLETATEYAEMWLRFSFSEFLKWYYGLHSQWLTSYITSYITKASTSIQEKLYWTPQEEEENIKDTNASFIGTNTFFFDSELPQEEIDRILKLQEDTKLCIRYF